MPYALNQITAPDNYSTAATIENVPISRVILDVSNQAIYWDLKQKLSENDAAGQWNEVPRYMIPGSRVLVRPGIIGIRIRAAIALAQLPAGTSQAIVTIEAVD